MVDKVAKEQAFLQILWFFPLSIIPLMHHIHLRVNTTFVRSTSGRNLEMLRLVLFQMSGINGQKTTLTWGFNAPSPTPPPPTPQDSEGA